ncbi:MAG: selenocysteine-specific translation elongation factor, partial [Chloroflexi bacterium]|nr:selenocysteine-specific translation elongation factor [Chloroflexota bacterium]
MFVIGTAGHVDHGKSALVKVLTGIDPDRLREEKERGMTIDLGFAWLALPSGRQVSIVDVPGHERFIRNMLAGVGGIDLALLVVAADEAIMPQTREHLAILDLLEVKRGIVAITKSDLVDQDWLDLVSAEVEDILKGTTLEGSPIYSVSAYTSHGLQELLVGIDETLEASEPRKDMGRPRLAIDRSFVMSGFGTVVTGTLIDGALTLGQEVDLTLAQKRARIRGLQTHRTSVETAQPGTRTAVNLSGVSHNEVQRGDVLTIPGWLRPTIAMDVHLRLIADVPRPLKHNTTVSLHIGTSETLAKVRLLDQNQLLPGEEGWAQLRLERPIALVKGDFFVIRSSESTLGGGSVVEPHAKRHRRLHAPTLSRLAVLQEGTTEEVLLQALQSSGPLNLETLARHANVSTRDIRAPLQALVDEGTVLTLTNGALTNSTVLLSSSAWTSIVEKVRSVLEAYHRQFPLRRGAPREELRGRLGLQTQVSAMAVQRLVNEGVLVIDGPSVYLPDHRIAPSPEQRRLMDDYVRLLESNLYSPPTSEPPESDLLNLLEK